MSEHPNQSDPDHLHGFLISKVRFRSCKKVNTKANVVPWGYHSDFICFFFLPFLLLSILKCFILSKTILQQKIGFYQKNLWWGDLENALLPITKSETILSEMLL